MLLNVASGKIQLVADATRKVNMVVNVIRNLTHLSHALIATIKATGLNNAS